MSRNGPSRTTTVAAFLAGILIASAGTATAAKLITGKQIKNGTITERDLSASVRKQLKRAGTPGPRGPAGPPGAALAAKIRGQASLGPVQAAAELDVPLTGNTWRQTAGTSNFVSGRVTREPAAPCGSAASLESQLVVRIDGAVVPFIKGTAPTEAGPGNALVVIVGTLPAPAADVDHTLTVRVRYSCSNVASEHEVEFDVLAAR